MLAADVEDDGRDGIASPSGLATRGDIYGAIRIQKPINGLLSVVDQSLCGVLLTP